MATQLCFDGMERPAKREKKWNPVPSTLARVQEYFRGFWNHRRQIYAKREHIAEKVGLKIRTLARYLKYLTENGWLRLNTVQRTARTAIREVTLLTFPIAGPSKEEKPEVQSAALPKRIQNILKDARPRIAKAKNPAAYRQSIISSELRLIKAAQEAALIERKPVQSEPTYLRGNELRDADEAAVDRMLRERRLA